MGITIVEMEILDDVAAYLVLSPLAIVVAVGIVAAVWALRHRTGGGNRLSS